MKRALAALVIAGLALGGGQLAWADFTSPVYNTSYGISSPYGPEKDLHSGLFDNPANPGGGNTVNFGDILDEVYGSWQRVHDNDASGPPVWDQIWRDLNGTGRVTAIYTSSTLSLGYVLNPNLNGPAPALSLFTADGGGPVDAVGDTATIDFLDTDRFAFGVTGTVTKYSIPGWNVPVYDMMVAYQILTDLQGDPLLNTYVIGFEDGTDYDYQDFVVTLSDVVPVPAPGAAVLGLVGLGLVSRIRRHFG